MRRIAALTGALLLLSGCAHDHTGPTAPPEPAAPALPAPADDASGAAVAAWIAAGNPVRSTDFQTVTHDGVATVLADGEVAFRPPGPLGPRALAGCVHLTGRGLSCLPALRDTPFRPADRPGRWAGDRVDFTGATVTVGSPPGDPAGFGNGSGNPLSHGDALKFGDYQCRSDPSGLYCANLVHHTAIRLSDTVTVFGCTRQATPPSGIGAQYYCD